MKKITILLLLSFFICGAVFSQIDDNEKQKDDEIRTILKKDASNGGYGAFTLGYQDIANKNGMSMGFRGAWIMKHSFALGLGAYGFFTEPEKDIRLSDDYKYSINGGWGGFLFEPIIGARYPVHFSLPVLVGVGAVAYTKAYTNDLNNWNDYDYEHLYVEDVEPFAIIKPGIEVEFNMVKYFRLNFGVYYSITSDIELTDDNNDLLFQKDFLNGLSFGATFKFGKF